VNLWNYVAIADDRKTAINDMRATVAFYASISQYGKYFAKHGFGEAAQRASTAAAGGDFAGMINAVPDEMVTTFSIAGTPDEARERVAQLWRHADSLTLVPPAQRQNVKSGQGQAYHDAITKTFYQT
jgi:alkanesulfonate monooxygenase SsuD/methylene tetrahydromethanopterin reductase-like flavin-dependent oxidoreductase (luciferase family)